MKKVYEENEVKNFLVDEAKKMLDEIQMYNMNIEFILVDKENVENSQVIVIQEDGEGGNILCPYTKDFLDVLEWDYSFDEYLFGELENGMTLIQMTDETHLAVWKEIEQMYPEDIAYQKGMHQYLKYCKENGITKDYLEKATNQKDLKDVTEYYKETKQKERDR